MSERSNALKSHVRDVPDFPKPGILFKDITPLLANASAFASTIDLLAEQVADRHIDRVVGIESRGFIFASALAVRLGTGFVPVRKPGKLPHASDRVSYALEYGEDALEMHKDALKPGSNVLVVDDVIATGGTAAAAAALVHRQGGVLAGFLFVVELMALGGRARLPKADVFSLLTF